MVGSFFVYMYFALCDVFFPVFLLETIRRLIDSLCSHNFITFYNMMSFSALNKQNASFVFNNAFSLSKN